MDEPAVVEQPQPAPKKSRRWLGLSIVAVLGLAALGGGAMFLLRGAEAEAAARLEDRGLVAFGDPFLVNLADSGGGRFLKANVQLVVGSTEDAEHIEKTPIVLMQLRSTILELLTQQTAAALVTPDGKQALKKAIADKANAAIAPRQVLDVLFSEFVVQF